MLDLPARNIVEKCRFEDISKAEAYHILADRQYPKDLGQNVSHQPQFQLCSCQIFEK
jgi:hypothetical protein